ncbi:MAG: hypothetical protein KKF30_07600 [Proteobacteria bacterium]|nr:hypothetical protein [Pseudomonadota bacterium]MBU4470267.1 hypothetical protein [Pseudomonadota bacterium]MCG2752681.1 hypothetical protein [Desulfobacteraceae bacterium]
MDQLSKAWRDSPINMGEFYFIREKAREVWAWEKEEARKAEVCLWLKRIILAVIIIAAMAVPVILTLAAK